MSVSTGHRGSPVLSIEADLELLIDGNSARLTGSGRSLVLEADRPAALWSSVSSAPLPAGIGRINGPKLVGGVAAKLVDLGITVSVNGPDGELVRIGAEARSRVGKWVTGSAAVQLGGARAVAPTALAVVRQTVARWGATGLARLKRLRRR